MKNRPKAPLIVAVVAVAISLCGLSVGFVTDRAEFDLFTHASVKSEEAEKFHEKLFEDVCALLQNDGFVLTETPGWYYEIENFRYREKPLRTFVKQVDPFTQC